MKNQIVSLCAKFIDNSSDMYDLNYTVCIIGDLYTN